MNTLTNGNLLKNADGGPGGVGATLTVPKKDGYANGSLNLNAFVDVPFDICLKRKAQFEFFVDVLGSVSTVGTSPNVLEEPQDQARGFKLSEPLMPPMAAPVQ